MKPNQNEQIEGKNTPLRKVVHYKTDGTPDLRIFNGRKEIGFTPEEKKARHKAVKKEWARKNTARICGPITTNRSRAEKIIEAKKLSGLSWTQIVCKGLGIQH